MSRSEKWYRKNEAEVMRSLGFNPTPNSGSGWIAKEDGENEYALCQLKSTDADSIRIQRRDLHTLECNAAISHKTPVFAIQFIRGNETWLMVKPEDLGALQAITGVCGETTLNSKYEFPFVEELEKKYDETLKKQAEKVIRSSEKARERFRQEVETKYKKKERSAT